jgi:hypothetical protein
LHRGLSRSGEKKGNRGRSGIFVKANLCKKLAANSIANDVICIQPSRSGEQEEAAKPELK